MGVRIITPFIFWAPKFSLFFVLSTSSSVYRLWIKIGCVQFPLPPPPLETVLLLKACHLKMKLPTSHHSSGGPDRHSPHAAISTQGKSYSVAEVRLTLS